MESGPVSLKLAGLTRISVSPGFELSAPERYKAMLSNNMKDLSNVSWEIFGMAGHLSAGRSGGDVFITKNTERMADLFRIFIV